MVINHLRRLCPPPPSPLSFPSADAYNRIGLANVSPLNIFQAMKCGTFSFERGWWIAKTKDRWKFLTFRPCKGWVWGVECVLGPRHSCVESERASRGSPLSLQLKGLAVIGTKALSSRFFSLLASLFCRPHTTATSMQASYLFWRVKFVLLGILKSAQAGKKVP